MCFLREDGGRHMEAEAERLDSINLSVPTRGADTNVPALPMTSGNTQARGRTGTCERWLSRISPSGNGCPGKTPLLEPSGPPPPPQQVSSISPPREVWETVPQGITANFHNLGTIHPPPLERAGGSFSLALSFCSWHCCYLVILFREGGQASSESPLKCWVKFFTRNPGHVYPASLAAGSRKRD